ncbi:PAS domain-containing protein [Neofusicoccum parvum]|uniref:PAS domain-containing protein n=1 Tax=Neofusicoccum parvum TaxID=310453 RepID=A0ACB5RYB1_9PEZI|nr:PAS domain-containing protein [Neofusicoccum parvum]
MDTSGLRRDGSPFINLCLVAPLYDNKGNVRYFIGCQVDVTNLIEGGKGLESFQLLLDQDLGAHEQYENPQKGSLKAIGGLGELLSSEEVDVLKHKSRDPTRNPNRNPNSTGSRSSTPAPPPPPSLGSTPNRRFVGVEDPLEINVWPPTQFGPHGRLPGVYQNFMLVRPWPSLRIIFTSAALRIPGLAQSRLLDRIGGPQSVREGIATAFAEGVRVTAKISWLTGSNAGWYSKDGAHDSHHPSRSNSMEGKPRYIHCTPLLGSDGVPGVWMVVMVENEDITGAINARRKRWGFSPVGPDTGVANSKFTQEKLFSQYRTREGGAHGAAGDGRARSRAESKVIADDNASTFFVDEEVPPPVSSIYAEYLANSAKRSASASRGPSRPPSRAPSRGTPSRGYASSPETPKKRQPRDEMVKMVRLPLPPDRLGEVVEQ